MSALYASIVIYYTCTFARIHHYHCHPLGNIPIHLLKSMNSLAWSMGRVFGLRELCLA